jgi:hypothetical protein
MAAETIKTGRVVTFSDTAVHELTFDSTINKSLRSSAADGSVRTAKIECITGSFKCGIGEAPDATYKTITAGNFVLHDFIPGLTNIFVKSETNPTTIVADV